MRTSHVSTTRLFHCATRWCNLSSMAGVALATELFKARFSDLVGIGDSIDASLSLTGDCGVEDGGSADTAASSRGGSLLFRVPIGIFGNKAREIKRVPYASSSSSSLLSRHRRWFGIWGRNLKIHKDHMGARSLRHGAAAHTSDHLAANGAAAFSLWPLFPTKIQPNMPGTSPPSHDLCC